ncbi:MAG: hypothetical protein QME77_13400 [bacterium]|nr:hypothetical protein [bacterium]
MAIRKAAPVKALKLRAVMEEKGLSEMVREAVDRYLEEAHRYR